jgi:hypothetical protein
MKSLLISVALGAGLLLSVGAYADAPAGSTAQCKDGTYYSGTSHKGACKGHDGVKEWLDKTAATPAAAPAATPAAAPAATPTPAATKKTKAKTTTAAAAPTPTAPADATAQCKDGTYYSGKTHKGACKGHQGVKAWLDNTAATAATKPVAPPAATPVAPAPAPVAPAPKAPPAATTAAPAAASAAPAATAPAAPAAAATHTAPTPASQLPQKAGGGPGLVWVNSASKVYHCQGDEWYGKTKEGSYMTEAAATAAGNHASHGKECGK